ncbi:kinase-like domain-containing protein [Rhizophagus irregularis DAOM 181602=DAOM 197198]|nr:kinase-like domain-containing protein [Rhizophagus irregularis DAOM 181602=DAOM 197198]
METEFSKLNNSGRNSNHKNFSYCNKLFTGELWRKECDPLRIMEGWTSGNSDIDKFIKDTIEGGFSKVYSTTWIYETKEFMMIIRFIAKGNLRSDLSINYLYGILIDLQNRILPQNFHSGNILKVIDRISDLDYQGQRNEQESDDKVVYRSNRTMLYYDNRFYYY